jgi:hypothetical protein
MATKAQLEATIADLQRENAQLKERLARTKSELDSATEHARTAIVAANARATLAAGGVPCEHCGGPLLNNACDFKMCPTNKPYTVVAISAETASILPLENPPRFGTMPEAEVDAARRNAALAERMAGRKFEDQLHIHFIGAMA